MMAITPSLKASSRLLTIVYFLFALLHSRAAFSQEIAQYRAVAMSFIFAIAADREIAGMREGGKQIKRCLTIRLRHLSAISFPELGPIARALRLLREFYCGGARRERGQPHIVEIPGRIILFWHAARRPPHRADAQALAGQAVATEANDTDSQAESGR